MLYIAGNPGAFPTHPIMILTQSALLLTMCNKARTFVRAHNAGPYPVTRQRVLVLLLMQLLLLLAYSCSLQALWCVHTQTTTFLNQ